MSRQILSLFIFFAFGTGLLAQKDRLPEDVVTFQDGTTANVFLHKTMALDLSREISFRRNDGDALETEGPLRIKDFVFARNGQHYRSLSVVFSDPNDGGVKKARQRFGEVLIDGEIQLLKVYLAPGEYDNNALGSENYLYVLRQGDIELTLELSSILVYDMLHANPARFRNKLKFFVRDCPDALEKARQARFNDVEIMRILNTYGKCENMEGLEIDNNLIRGGVRFRHYARVMNLDIRDKNYDEEQLSFGMGYQLETHFVSRMKWLGVLASADFVYNSFRWEESSNISQSMFKGNLSLVVHALQRERLGIQLTAGLNNYNAFSSSFNSFFSNNYFLLDAGLRIQADNFLLGINYEYMPNQIKRQPGNILVVSAGYRIRF